MRRRRLAAAAAVAGWGLIALAQAPEMQFTGHAWRPGFTFNTQADLIEIPVTVTDAQGHALSGLRESDFVVLDNGKPQPLTLFQVLAGSGGAAATPAPAGTGTAAAVSTGRSVGLLFDDLNTRGMQLAFLRRAAANYVAASTDPNERFAVLTTSQAGELAFTADHAAIAAALRGFGSRATMGGALQPAPTSGLTEPMHGGGNADEMVETFEQRALDGIRAAVHYTGQQPGSKVVVLASPGFPTRFPANGEDLDAEVNAMVAEALATRVIVNTLDATMLNPSARGLVHWQADAGLLNEVASATGGRLIENTNALEPAYRTLGNGPAVSYYLGFTPGQLKMDGSYHRLTVKLQPGVAAHAHIRARVGYYAPAADSAAALAKTLDAKLQQALHGADLNELAAEAVVEPRDGRSGLLVTVVVDCRTLPLVRWPGSRGQPVHWRERVRLTAVLSDAQGRFLAGEQGIERMNVSAASLERLRRTGLQLGMRLPAPQPPGHYRLQIVVQDGARARTTAWTRTLTLR